MKVGLISDLHFGVKKSDDAFFESQVKFIREVYIPTLKKREVKSVFVLGDIFNDRKSISVKILDSVSKLFKEDFADFELHVLVGNHDMYYSTGTEVNSVNYLSFISPNIKVYTNIEQVGDFLIVPWLSEYNKAAFDSLLTNEIISAKYALGHFEILGFDIPESANQNVFQVTLDLFFDNFERTFSGHIHTPGVRTEGDKECRYIGAPYQMTRTDKGGQRGAYIFDTETKFLEFVENKVSAKFVDLEYPREPKEKDVAGNIVDVIVRTEDLNDKKLDEYLALVSSFKPMGQPTVKVVKQDQLQNATIETDNKTMSEVLMEYVDTRDDIENKDRIKSELLALLKENSD